MPLMRPIRINFLSVHLNEKVTFSIKNGFYEMIFYFDGFANGQINKIS